MLQKKLDLPTLFIITGLMCVSLLSLYSISYTIPDSTDFFSKQLLWFLIGFPVYFAFLKIPTRISANYSYVLYALVILSLIVVLFFGNYVNGSRRWFLLGPLKFQPSEPAKFITLLALARYVSDSSTDLSKFKDLLIAVLILFIPFFLIYVQPDLGTALTILAIALPVLYWGGMPGFYVFALLSTILVLLCSFNMFIYLSVITICIIFIYFFKTSPYLKIALMSIYIISGYAAPKIWNDVLKPHQRSRIMTLVDPTDKKGSGYQVHQGMIAIGSGGDFGKGFTKGTQVQLGLVPEVQTDFAICIFAEEFGYFGILIVLALFAVLIMRLIFYASQTRNRFNSVMLLGTASIFLYHVFTNMGMTVGIMPVTGIPLPLVSYGGTFILTCMMMLGYCSNLIINRFEV